MKRLIIFLMILGFVVILGCAPRSPEEAIDIVESRIEELGGQQIEEIVSQQTTSQSDQDANDDNITSSTTQTTDEEEPQETEIPEIAISEKNNIIPQTSDEIYLFAIAIYKDYLNTLQEPKDLTLYSCVVKEIHDVSPANPGTLSKYELQEVAYYFMFNYSLDKSGQVYNVKYTLEKDGDLNTDGEVRGGVHTDIDSAQHYDEFSIYKLETWKFGQMALADIMQSNDTHSVNAEEGLVGFDWTTYAGTLYIYVEDMGLCYELYWEGENAETLDMSQIPVLEKGDRLVCGQPSSWNLSIISAFTNENGDIDLDWSSEKRIEVAPEMGINYFGFVDLPDDMLISDLGLYFLYVDYSNQGPELSEHSSPVLYKGFVFIDDECF